MFGFGSAKSTTPVVKNLIYINIIMFLGTYFVDARFDNWATQNLALHFFESSSFKPVQLVTHMFMHGNLLHIFFNMWGLWMFGNVLESVWGSKRFFVYYMVTGLGAAALHLLVNYIEFQSFASKLEPNQLQIVLSQGLEVLNQGKNYTDPLMGKLNLMLNTPTVGASGAVFGVLLAFGMLFPNTELMLLFPPIPIKAKYFVLGYGAIELYLGLSQPGSNVAHFAHLGGMLFGFILIKYWNSKRTNFY